MYNQYISYCRDEDIIIYSPDYDDDDTIIPYSVLEGPWDSEEYYFQNSTVYNEEELDVIVIMWYFKSIGSSSFYFDYEYVENTVGKIMSLRSALDKAKELQAYIEDIKAGKFEEVYKAENGNYYKDSDFATTTVILGLNSKSPADFSQYNPDAEFISYAYGGEIRFIIAVDR
ncbi:UNVERIFIED_ORG: hypothetical protein [Escherichia phage CMSTMSU]